MKSKRPAAPKGNYQGGSSPEPLLRSPKKAESVSSEELADHNLLHITKFSVE
jgi:hypothetical protein